MSVQHVQAYIAELYDYSAPQWGTPRSSYVRQDLAHLTEGKPRPADSPPTHATPRSPHLSRDERARLRARVDELLAKDPCPVRVYRVPPQPARSSQ